MARPERFELPTTKFVAWYSIQLSYGRVVKPLPSSLNHRSGKRRSEKRNYSDSGGSRQYFFQFFFTGCRSIHVPVLPIRIEAAHSNGRKQDRLEGKQNVLLRSASRVVRHPSMLETTRAAIAALVAIAMPCPLSRADDGSAWPGRPPSRRHRRAAAEAAGWNRWRTWSNPPAGPARGPP